jgi:pimeloyl-ACP methyl ester carboxylesterase
VLLAPVGFGEVNLLRLLKLATPSAIAPLLPYLVPRWTVTLGLRLAYGGLGRFDRRDVDEYWAPTQFPEFVCAMRELAHAFSWDTVTEDDLRRLATPALILFGTADRFVRPGRAEELARAMPNGRCEMIEGGGHVIPEEAPGRVNDAVVDFLREPMSAPCGPVQRVP